MSLQISRQCKAVLGFANKDANRWAAHHVLFKEDQLVATNGHMLAILTMAPNEVPTWVPEYTEGVPKNGTILNVSDVESIIKMLPTAKTLSVADRQAYVHSNVYDKYLCLTFKNRQGGDQLLTMPVRVEDEKFPDYEQAIPKDVPDVRIALSPKYLKQLAEAAITIGAESLQFYIYPKYASGVGLARVHATNDSGYHLMMLLMGQHIKQFDLGLSQDFEPQQLEETWDGVE